jgi:hypothetical protein
LRGFEDRLENKGVFYPTYFLLARSKTRNRVSLVIIKFKINNIIISIA